MEAEEKIRKQLEDEETRERKQQEQLKKQQELEEERIKRLQKVKQLRERKEAEENIRKQLRNFTMRPDKTPYTADIELENTTPKKVTIRIQFDRTTHKRLTQELACYSGDKAQLRFSVAVTNLQTRTKRSDEFIGKVNLVNNLPLRYSMKLGDRYKYKVDVKKFSSLHGDFHNFSNQGS